MQDCQGELLQPDGCHLAPKRKKPTPGMDLRPDMGLLKCKVDECGICSEAQGAFMRILMEVLNDSKGRPFTFEDLRLKVFDRCAQCYLV